MSATALKTINIHVVSDSICPFCYIGYKEITSAMELAKKEKLPVEFKMKYNPFQLDPTLSMTHPINKHERLKGKLGASRVDAVERDVIARAKEAGIQNFNYGGLIRQSTDSHRLIAKAYELGGEARQRAFLDVLFPGYFERSQDIGDHDFLAETAVAGGVYATKAEALAFLKSSEGVDEYKKNVREAQQRGVHGVPHFTFNNKYAVSGAQGPDGFLDIFRQLAKK
ncbi:thioredoxin-like protein [Mycena belliarum]|uniref:Thioredoxin-like protein n=1 Tax=Mycena belliarum TaxID=1033014 RepID=A0AAD6U461_9AGAR|nr:thioredoxin-like protein [Mycena belliae]